VKREITNSKSLNGALRPTPFIALGEWGKIEFDSMDTLQGLWEGGLIEVTITSPYNGTWTVFSAHELPWRVFSPNASWDEGGVTLKDTQGKATPYLLTMFPTDEFLHKWINGKAKMSVFYPVWKIAYEWETEIKHVELNFNFYVVTTEEAKVIDAHNNWESKVSSQNTATIWAILIGLVFLFFRELY
jgi:hypothetical protein